MHSSRMVSSGSDRPTAPGGAEQFLHKGAEPEDGDAVRTAIATAVIKHRRLWLYEKRLKEHLTWIEQRLAVLARDMEPGSLHRQRTRCGAKCSCNRGRGHGPYWFLYRSTETGLVKRYVRRSDVQRVRRRLNNYQEYQAIVREADRIEEYLDVSVVDDDLKLASELLKLLRIQAQLRAEAEIGGDGRAQTSRAAAEM
jgi:hypothetical protein